MARGQNLVRRFTVLDFPVSLVAVLRKAEMAHQSFFAQAIVGADKAAVVLHFGCVVVAEVKHHIVKIAEPRACQTFFDEIVVSLLVNRASLVIAAPAPECGPRRCWA